MKIKSITLKDFRGFPGPDSCFFDLDQGRNFLLYGENGSGKSSLFEALKGVLNHRAPTIFGDNHANVFASSDDGFVRIEIPGAPDDEYRWDQGEEPIVGASQTQYFDIARRAVFLDYRDLLKTHFIHRDADRINLFDLLVGSLLADIDFGDGRTLSAHWQDLQGARGELPVEEEEGEEEFPYDPFGAVVAAADAFRA